MKAITASELPPPAGHYLHAMRAGGLLYLSGLLGVRLGKFDDSLPEVRAQAAAVLHRLDQVLAAAGLQSCHVARLGVYIIDAAHWSAVNAAYAAHFGSHRPARTILTCPGLHYGSLVEIDAIASFAEPRT
jgi:2-iminobutanoate/2-iminopropanoate deaminase